MFFQLLFIHLFRPFLKYKPASSPLPAHISPRKFLLHAATMISKLLRLYKRTHGLRQICNIAVYITHSACTVHLLNLPDKNAARDVVHGLKHLEEIAESWLCARRTLGILHLVAKRWNSELPEEASKTFLRCDTKFGPLKSHDHEASPKLENQMSPPTPMQPLPPPATNGQPSDGQKAGIGPPANNFLPKSAPLTNSMPIPDVPRLGGALTLPQQSTADFGRQSRQQHYVLPQAQQKIWNQQHDGQAPASQARQTSPTAMFGGIGPLMQDQEWWLHDSNQFFANWNGMDQQELVMRGSNGFNNNGIGNGMGNGIGSIDYSNGHYGMNGVNSYASANGHL